MASLALGCGSAAADTPSTGQIVAVEGLRADAESGERRRREAAGIVDAVLAREIGRLPDLSVADALQRITGVQVARDRGEASTFAVRGLVQVETLLNGREIFTAGSGRLLDLADFAAESLAGIDVHKTAAAHRLDGGLGGSVDLRTRRPLDLRGDATTVSLRWMEGDLAGRGGAQGSLLLSRRVALQGGGRAGLLLGVVSQQRAWREDQKATSPMQLRNDVLPGSRVAVPGGTSETISLGTRRRQGLDLVLQWQPSPATEWLAEVHAAELRTRQDSHQLNVGAGTGVEAGSVRLLETAGEPPAVPIVQAITWTDAPASLLGFARDTLDRTRQLALGARHAIDESWTASVDASHTRSVNRLFFSGPVLASRAARFSQDLGGAVPATAVPGDELLDASRWRVTSLAYRVRPFVGELTALRGDLQWQVDGAVIDRVSFGWRSARRRAHNGTGLVFGDVAVAAPGDTPGRLLPNTLGALLGGAGDSIERHLVASLDGVRDAQALRDAYGVTAPLPVDGAALARWRIGERTDSAYLQIEGGTPASGLFAQAGLRVTRTSLRVDGAQSVPSTGSVLPLQVDGRYTDPLPSLSLRWRATSALQLRAAASRTITRPNFDQLSPSLTLVRNSVNPERNVGGAGNPQLRPMRSENLDLAIESAAAGRSAASATLFWKSVDGFVASESRPETWDGAVYQVSRPYNSDPATVRGLEVAGLHFFDRLPGAWAGLGVQANYSFVDSRTPDRRLGAEVPLQNLSRHSANLIGLYERGPWGARLAWNWRSRFLSGVDTVVGLGAQPVYTAAYGWLDAAASFRLDARTRLSIEGGNLLRTLRTAYQGGANRPQSAWINDRQWALVLGVSL